MRRAALALVVTVLVVVAGIWLREQGAPLHGGAEVWSSTDPLLRDVSTVVSTGPRHTALRAADQAPVLVDRRDGSALRLRGSRVVAVSGDGTAVSFAEGRLYGDRASRPWAKETAAPLGGRAPVFPGSDGEVVAVGGCRGGEGVVVGLAVESGDEAWRVDGRCPVEGDPSAAQRYLLATRPAQAYPDGPAVDAFLHELSDGRQVAAFPRVRDAHLVDDRLLVLDGDRQLSAHDGTEQRWLLDPQTAALADTGAADLDDGFTGTPVIRFTDDSRALVDPATGTLRRAQPWGAGPLVEAGEAVVAHGREHVWEGRTLVVRDVFTGRELWRTRPAAASASASVFDPALVVVSLRHADGRRQVVTLDAGSGERLTRSRRTEETWRLLPTGDGTVLATDGARHYLLAVSD